MLSLNNTINLSEISYSRRVLALLCFILAYLLTYGVVYADSLTEDWDQLSDLLTHIHEVSEMSMMVAGPFQVSIWRNIGQLLFFLFVIGVGLSLLGMTVHLPTNPIKVMLALIIILVINHPMTIARPAGQLTEAVKQKVDQFRPSGDGVEVSFGYYWIMKIAGTASDIVMGTVYDNVERSQSDGRSYQGIPLWLFGELQRSYGEVISEAPRFQQAFSTYATVCLKNSHRAAAENNYNININDWRRAGFYGEWRLGANGQCVTNLNSNVDTSLTNAYLNPSNTPPAAGLGYRIVNGNGGSGPFLPVIQEIAADTNQDGEVYTSDALRTFQIPTEHYWYFKMSGGHPPSEDPVSTQPMMMDATSATPNSCFSSNYRYQLNDGVNFHAMNCKQLFEILDTGFVNFHKAHKKLFIRKHNLAQAANNGDIPNNILATLPGYTLAVGYDALSNTATSKMYQSMLANSKYGQVAHTTTGDGKVDDGFLSFFTGLFKDQGNTLRANWNTVGHRTDAFFEKFKLDVDIPLLIGFIGALLIVLGVVFPVFTIFAVLPGRAGTITLYIKMLAYLHIVIVFIYLVLKIGGIATEALFLMTSNYTDVGVPFNRATAMLGGTIEFGMYAALASAFVISFFMLQGTEQGLKQFSGRLPRTERDNTSANVKTIGAILASAFAGTKVAGMLKGGAAAASTKITATDKVVKTAGGSFSVDKSVTMTSTPTKSGGSGGISAAMMAMSQIDKMFQGAAKKR